jgi:hypothetical protein
MSQPSPQEKASNDLQFNTVEPVASVSNETVTGPQCVTCQKPIVGTYYTIGDKLLCPECGEKAKISPSGSRFGRLARAGCFGLAAGLVGAMIWFAIRKIAHVEVGIVAVLVGYMVGKAMQRGSRGQGGLGYQILAVVLTYCCIAANYMPDVFEAFLKMAEEHRTAKAQQAKDNGNAEAPDAKAADRPAANAEQLPKAHTSFGGALLALVIVVGFVFAVSLTAPFLGGAENLIGLLIIGFALWEAWKLNARRAVPISGPYQLGPIASA